MGNIKTFQVTTTSPLNGGKDISINSDIVITFNTDIDKLTIFNSILVMDHVTGKVVPGVIQYDNNKHLTFKPNEPFLTDNTYDVYVKKSLKNILGNTCRDYNFSFSTLQLNEVVNSPELIMPSDMETILTQPIFKFNSIYGATKYEIQLSSSYEFSTIVWSTIINLNAPDVANRLIEIIPTYVAEESKLYFWRVRASLFNLEGEVVNGMWSNLYRFIIKSEINPIILDEDNPPLPVIEHETIIETFPEKEFSNVGVNIKTIYIVINKILNPATINPKDWLIVGKHVTGDDLAPDWDSTLSAAVKRFNHGQLYGSWSIIIDEENNKTIIVFQPNTL